MEKVRWKEGGRRLRQEEMEREVREVERELRGKGRRKRGWWDEECEDRKKEARKELRSWRRVEGERKEYRKGYRELCERKKKEEKWERRAMEVKRESKVWELINRERKKRARINEGIEMEEWKEYFMGLLGGVEGRMVMSGRGRREGWGRRRWI